MDAVASPEFLGEQEEDWCFHLVKVTGDGDVLCPNEEESGNIEDLMRDANDVNEPEEQERKRLLDRLDVINSLITKLGDYQKVSGQLPKVEKSELSTLTKEAQAPSVSLGTLSEAVLASGSGDVDLLDDDDVALIEADDLQNMQSIGFEASFELGSWGGTPLDDTGTLAKVPSPFNNFDILDVSPEMPSDDLEVAIPLRGPRNAPKAKVKQKTVEERVFIEPAASQNKRPREESRAVSSTATTPIEDDPRSRKKTRQITPVRPYSPEADRYDDDSDELTDDESPTGARKMSGSKRHNADGGRRSKHHNPWALEEAEALVEGVARCGGGKWADIKKLGFPAIQNRSAVDLKPVQREVVLRMAGVIAGG
eukprot:gene10579-12514_t